MSFPRLVKGRVKDLAGLKERKNRVESGCVLVNGLRLIRQCLQNRVFPSEIYLTESRPEYLELLSVIPDTTVFEVCPHDMERISDVETPQGIAGLYSIVPKPIPFSPLILYLDRIADPGNLGTILRTASAINVPVLVSPDSCDLYNTKVVRSSLGAALFHPATYADFEEILAMDACRVAMDMSGDNLFSYRPETVRKTILMVGSEAHGLRRELVDSADARLSIPQTDMMESLNASVAASIGMYHLAMVVGIVPST